MTFIIDKSPSISDLTNIGKDAILNKLGKSGRLPTISLTVSPLTQLAIPSVIDRFLSYQFSSSVLIPVSSFSFSFAAPFGDSVYDSIKDGDIVNLTANDVPICTGLIDSIEIETEANSGEKATINGRDLISQLEDQDAITADSKPIYSDPVSIYNGVLKLIENTRIKTPPDIRNAPVGSFLLATEPGESKLAALQRFIEPLNCIAWSSPNGRIIVGKPNMSQSSKGSIFILKGDRKANALSMRATFAATTIPTAICAIIAGQDQAISSLPFKTNAAKRPSQLHSLGHKVFKTVVVSNPTANESIAFGDFSNVVESYRNREFARKNVGELIVQAVVPGHFNDSGEPFSVDTVYNIVYDRANINEAMYLYQVDYELSETSGQRSTLHFCRLGTIVAGVSAP